MIGKPLRDVLQELLVDMRICSEAGGRIAVHHLEFDCGIIAMELKRARLEQHCVEWANFAAKGICTLSPAIGKWVCQCVGRDTGPENKMNTLRLSDLVDTLLPGHPLKRQMHTAGADAQMHRPAAWHCNAETIEATDQWHIERTPAASGMQIYPISVALR